MLACKHLMNTLLRVHKGAGVELLFTGGTTSVKFVNTSRGGIFVHQGEGKPC